MKYWYIWACLVITSLLDLYTFANSVDDKLNSAKNYEPELPRNEDQLIMVSEENFLSLLQTQYSPNIVDKKRHKPLLLALVVRDADGSLEF